MILRPSFRVYGALKTLKSCIGLGLEAKVLGLDQQQRPDSLARLYLLIVPQLAHVYFRCKLTCSVHLCKAGCSVDAC